MLKIFLIILNLGLINLKFYLIILMDSPKRSISITIKEEEKEENDFNTLLEKLSENISPDNDVNEEQLEKFNKLLNKITHEIIDKKEENNIVEEKNNDDKIDNIVKELTNKILQENNIVEEKNDHEEENNIVEEKNDHEEENNIVEENNVLNQDELQDLLQKLTENNDSQDKKNNIIENLLLKKIPGTFLGKGKKLFKIAQIYKEPIINSINIENNNNNIKNLTKKSAVFLLDKLLTMDVLE
jgi:hypothetical protein